MARPTVAAVVAPAPMPPRAEPLPVAAERIAATYAPPVAPPPEPVYTANGLAEVTPERLRRTLRYLDADDRMRLFAAIEGRDEPQLTFAQWILTARQGYVMYTFAQHIIPVLQDVADGLRKRVMVFLPPQIGKSELVSRLFSAYYLYRYPHHTVGLAGHTANLVREMARDSRNNFTEAGGDVASDSRKVSYWRTEDGGGMWSAGIKGGGTGFGFNLGIIDDPFKNRQEAESAVIRKNVTDWFDSVFLTRMRTDAAMIILMTRWHLADLAGHLLARELEAPEFWHVVRYEALKEASKPKAVPRVPGIGWGPAGRPAELDDADRLPATCTLEPDWRQPGESICEPVKSRASLEHLRQTYGGANGYVWNAMFQQRPVPPEGGMFTRTMFQRIQRGQAPPWDALDLVRSWDLAATEGAGDHTVGLLMGRGIENTPWAARTYILDAQRGQWGSTRRDTQIRETAERDGPAVTQVFARDPGQAGVSQVGAMAALVAGYQWAAMPVSGQGNKALRAGPMASDAGANMYYIVDDVAWTEAVIRVFTNFGPASGEDDDVDAGSQGHQFLAARARSRAQIAGHHRTHEGATAHDRALAVAARPR